MYIENVRAKAPIYKVKNANQMTAARPFSPTDGRTKQRQKKRHTTEPNRKSVI